MSHFVGLIFGPKESISERLAPYDEQLEVDPYIDKNPDELMVWAKDRAKSMKEYVKQHIEDEESSYTHKRALEMQQSLEEDWNNFESKDDYLRLINRHFTLDEQGNSITTYNPDSKWDWYVQGGRWSGEILHAGSYDTDQATIEDLTKIDTPYCFIDLDGGWHEKGSMGWWGMAFDEKDDGTWETEFREYLKTLPKDTLVTVIDFHI